MFFFWGGEEAASDEMKRPSDKQQPLSTKRHLVYNIFFIDIAKTILQKKKKKTQKT